MDIIVIGHRREKKVSMAQNHKRKERSSVHSANTQYAIYIILLTSVK
jgi:hypothetical protein